MAREVAWALQDAGCPDLALAVLGSDPDLALHRALLVAEPGAGAALPLVVPEDVLTAPGLLISRDEILENEQIQVLFAVDESLSSVRMEATGQPFLGPPELTLSVAGEEVATVEVPEDLGSWTFDRPLRRGVYRLALAYTNDHYNESGNRNVYRVRVWVE